MNGSRDNKHRNDEIDRSLFDTLCEAIRRIFNTLMNFLSCNNTRKKRSTDHVDGRIRRTFRRWESHLRNAFTIRRRMSPSGSVSEYPRVPLSPLKLEREYDMTHENRGIAVIFNQENFDYETFHSRRIGTQIDLQRLTATLQRLNFDVRDFTDLRKEAIIKHLQKVSSSNHRHSDCLLIIILTHGELGRIFSRDEAYTVNLVTSFFTDDKCPTLRGKPKLFFIQSCRGEMRDQGYRLDASAHYRLRRQSLGAYEEVDVTTFDTFYPREEEEMVHNPPTHRDFLIVRSTMPNYVSFRNTTHGSWFIQDLCDQLDKHAYEMDILRLLTAVNQLVSLRESVPQGQKQVLCISSMLTKLMQFKPKKKDQKKAMSNGN